MITTPLSFLFAKNAKYITRGISIFFIFFERNDDYEKHEEIFENSQMDIVSRNCCGVLRDGYLYEDQIKEEIVLLLEINEQRR